MYDQQVVSPRFCCYLADTSLYNYFLFSIVPCELTTLEEKMRAMKNHSSHDSSLSEAHIFWLNSTTTEILDEHLHNMGFIPQAYNVKDTGAICTVLFLLSAGSKTNVDYLHSHPDQFLSFGLEKSKVWEFIHPLHVDKFETTWSGQSLVMTKQKERVPVISTLNQEPGDVLFVPPWWMHKTSRKNDTYSRHASMNVSLSNGAKFVCIWSIYAFFSRDGEDYGTAYLLKISLHDIL